MVNKLRAERRSKETTSAHSCKESPQQPNQRRVVVVVKRKSEQADVHWQRYLFSLYQHWSVNGAIQYGG